MKNYELEIEKLDYFARGIAKKEGKIYFIKNALPNEKVNIKVTNEKKKYKEGEIINIIDKSKYRTIPECIYYNYCGGCNLMHLVYDKQLKYKENIVKEILLRECNFNNVKNIIKSNNLNYRNKITLHVNDKIGLYKDKTHEIIEIKECLIVDKRINDVLNRLKYINLDGINKIVIRTTTNEIMMVFYSNKKIFLDLNMFKDINTIICICDSTYILKGNGYIKENINNIEYVISNTSFFQVNTYSMINLYNKILEYCNLNGSENILDLYCGTGTIGIYVSKYCKKVLGVEINEDAIKDANKNKDINNIDNIEFMVGDVKRVLKNKKFNADIVIVDPPRSGLDKDVINKIIDIYPNKIIYVSCNPITLARDLNLLKIKYDIKELTPVDMFPNTYHVECVCLLKLK